MDEHIIIDYADTLRAAAETRIAELEGDIARWLEREPQSALRTEVELRKQAEQRIAELQAEVERYRAVCAANDAALLQRIDNYRGDIAAQSAHISELKARIAAALAVKEPILERYTDSTLIDYDGYSSAINYRMAEMRAILRGETI